MFDRLKLTFMWGPSVTNSIMFQAILKNDSCRAEVGKKVFYSNPESLAVNDPMPFKVTVPGDVYDFVDESLEITPSPLW
ncbi:7958_t:CDS:2 [Acaulospora morrowiae]|uniref:7958_t:CDS:1 n=1 Tax=Acaulospora morrowiae TaxID=94023 RepID=A0A9N8ZMH9_9GLOM|nr:7958_t:CDS:2 [Acaulospora morrowiae]